MILDRNKNKLKIQINKALQTVNNIVKPTSEIKSLLEQSQKDVNFQKNDKLHETLIDTEDGRQFITCQFSRQPKSNNYRSPYTNRYYPQHQEDAVMLTPMLRDIEEKGNLLFSEYAKLYYGNESCISNFYVHQSEQGLNFGFYVRKIYKDPECFGIWCSSNTVEIRGDPQKNSSYKLQTTIIYQFNVLNQATKQLVQIYGSTKKNRVETKRWTPEYEIEEFHLLVSGKLIEQVQTQLRQQLESVFVRKTKQIIFKTRFINSKQQQNQKIKLGKELARIRSESTRVIDS